MDSVSKHFDEFIFETSAVRGQEVKVPYPLPFSFYFSPGVWAQTCIRVQPVFNPKRLIMSETGFLQLCDDWTFIPGRGDQGVSSDAVQEMKAFFRQYIVLFCAVWDEQMQDAVLRDYFEGRIGFDEMLQDLDFYDEYKDELARIHDIQSLESFCRGKDLVNLYGN